MKNWSIKKAHRRSITAHNANRADDKSNKLKPSISFPVLEATSRAYTMASIEPVTSNILVSLRLEPIIYLLSIVHYARQPYDSKIIVNDEGYVSLYLLTVTFNIYLLNFISISCD